MRDLMIETIWVSVNFDFFMEPPDCENMPESSTPGVSIYRGSLRSGTMMHCIIR